MASKAAAWGLFCIYTNALCNELYNNSHSEEYRDNLQEHLSRTINGTVIGGERDNVLFPVNTENEISSYSLFRTTSTEFLDKSKYALIMENETMEIKLYARITDGELTAD